MVTAGLLLGDRYRLVSRIGRGGMAEVWAGVDTVLEREVAVKIPNADDAPAYGDRLRREARTAARLAHPHIAAVHDYGEARADGHERVPYVVMELLRGESLAARLRGGPLPWATAATLFAQVADGLAVAHSVGVVHRDLNPSNVFLTAAGARILDFGIAYTASDDTTTPLMGTPGFVAPELLAGARPAPAADMYGFGASLDAALPEDEDEGVPAGLRDLCARCRSPHPDDRPGAAAAAAALRALAPAHGPRTEEATTGPADGAAPPPPTRAYTGQVVSRRRSPASWTVRWAVGGVLALVVVVAVLVRAKPGDTVDGHAAPRTTPPSAPVCRVAYTVDGQWPGGFKASVRVTNTGRTVINGWTVRWSFADGQRITGLWNGARRQSGAAVTVTNVDSNVSIKPRRTVDFGFTAARHDANTRPAAFTLNGRPCRT